MIVPARPNPDQIAFSTLVSAAYASAAVALLFLVVDAVRGDPLATPSLLGTVVLLGEPASAATAVRLDMVALYSLVHFVGFSIIGLVATLATLRFETLRAQPLVLGAVLLIALTLGSAAVDALLVPGLVAAIGPVALTSANVLASAVMAGFVFSATTSKSFAPIA